MQENISAPRTVREQWSFFSFASRGPVLRQYLLVDMCERMLFFFRVWRNGGVDYGFLTTRVAIVFAARPRTDQTHRRSTCAPGSPVVTPAEAKVSVSRCPSMGSMGEFIFGTPVHQPSRFHYGTFNRQLHPSRSWGLPCRNRVLLMCFSLYFKFFVLMEPQQQQQKSSTKIAGSTFRPYAAQQTFHPSLFGLWWVLVFVLHP